VTLNSTPVLASSVKAFVRSVLFSVGMDHLLMDFLAHSAIGAATVLLAVLFAGIRIPRRSRPQSAAPPASPIHPNRCPFPRLSSFPCFVPI